MKEGRKQKREAGNAFWEGPEKVKNTQDGLRGNYALQGRQSQGETGIREGERPIHSNGAVINEWMHGGTKVHHFKRANAKVSTS